MKKRKVTFPPMQGITPEYQQARRQALIARKHAAQQMRALDTPEQVLNAYQCTKCGNRHSAFNVPKACQ